MKPIPHNSDAPDDPWKSGWEDTERRHVEQWAKLSLKEKLIWLEQAHQVARNLQVSREKTLGSQPNV